MKSYVNVTLLHAIVFIKCIQFQRMETYKALEILHENYQKSLFSSPQLKAQVSFSEHLSSVCPSVSIFFSRTTGPISIKLGTKHPWVARIQICSNKGLLPFLREDNNKNSKNTLMKDSDLFK